VSTSKNDLGSTITTYEWKVSHFVHGQKSLTAINKGADAQVDFFVGTEIAFGTAIVLDVASFCTHLKKTEMTKDEV
jgi:hypothetical protein